MQMTDKEKELITKMRMNELGYLSIAFFLGITRDAVKNFSNSACMDG